MLEIDPTAPDAPVRLAGIAELFPTGAGATLSRLPRWALDRTTDLAVPVVASMPSGGRISMVTTATTIELDVQLTRLRLLDRPEGASVFDLTVDGELVADATTDACHVIHVADTTQTDIRFLLGEPATVRFDGLAPGRKHVEVWLPHDAGVELRAMRIDDGATIEPGAPVGPRWVHYGSSISHCLEAERPTGVWPVVAARLAGVDLMNLGLAGQCQLDGFVARMLRDEPLDLLSMKVGINVVNLDAMRERSFVPVVHSFLDTVRDGHPTTPIVIISPIICPVAEDHPGPTVPGSSGTIEVVARPAALAVGSLSIGRIREVLAGVVAQRRAAGDAALHLLDGRELFGADDLADLPDGLHPNAAGYRRMGERFHARAFAPGGPFAGR